jgi:hypothetical protein
MQNESVEPAIPDWTEPGISWPGEDAGSGRRWCGVVALIIAAALFLNQPTRETLYIGLSGEDMTQISLVLAEANIDFASGTDGNSITVPAGMTSRARMLLAERGLPSSTRPATNCLTRSALSA